MNMKTISKPLLLVGLMAALGVALFAWHEEAIEDDDEVQAATPSAAESRAALPLKTVADIELPGATNRFDYQSYDPRTHLLFIAHLAAGTVVAFNTQSNKVVAEIPGASQVHGVLVGPHLG